MSITGSLAEEALSSRATRSGNGLAKRLTDDPATDLNIKANLRPASMQAVTSLAQDTISAVALVPGDDIAPGGWLFSPTRSAVTRKRCTSAKPRTTSRACDG